jgi:hypothetical protein
LYRFVGAVALVALLACTGPVGPTVPVPASDSTPPVLTALETLDRVGGQLSVTPSSGAVAGSWSGAESLTISARVDDPEGAREVAIWGTTRTTCFSADGTGSGGNPGLASAPLAVNSDSATPGGATQTGRVVTYTIRMSDFSCAPEFVGLSVEHVLWAIGRNYGGGEARSANLTLTHKRGTTP